MDDYKKKVAPLFKKSKTSCSLPSQDAAISEGTLVAPSEKTDIRKQEINTETRLSFYQDWGRLSTEDVRKKLRINEEQDMSLFFPSNEKDKLPSVEFTNISETPA